MLYLQMSLHFKLCDGEYIIIVYRQVYRVYAQLNLDVWNLFKYGVALVITVQPQQL